MLVLVSGLLIAALAATPGSMAAWVKTVETSPLVVATGSAEMHDRQEGEGVPPLSTGRVPAEPLEAGEDSGDLLPDAAEVAPDPVDGADECVTDEPSAGERAETTDPCTLPAPEASSPGPDETAPVDPAPDAETIAGTLEVSAPTAVTIGSAGDGTVSIPVTLRNAGTTTTWTGMRIHVAVDQAASPEAEVRYQHGTCSAETTGGTPLGPDPVDDATVALAPGESQTLCLTVTYQGSADQVGDVDATLSVTVEGTAHEDATGGVTVPLAFTIPAAPAAPSAPRTGDESGDPRLEPSGDEIAPSPSEAEESNAHD